MIKLKTDQEIEIMIEGGRRLRNTYQELKKNIKPGLTTKTIDTIAETLVKKAGGEASFKKVKDYYWTTCLSINDQIVHTPPSSRIIEEGDILTIDIGMYYQGYNTDFADSFVVGSTKDKKTLDFLQVGKDTLMKVIKECKINNHIGDISKVIENEIYSHGYYVIKQLTGHGIGRELHEDPYVMGFVDKPIKKTALIKNGLTVAIEIIYSMGTENIKYENDDWSLATDDGSLSACFEHTVAITNKNTLILT